jgi:DNA (cytosine-5)-methyltransferase 1
MNYSDVCTGIGAPTVAWKPLGWKAQWFSEIEPFPCKVLKYHYPDIPNLGDMMKLENNEIFRHSNIDVFVGGTPCQSFSLAGLRGGMADVRGNLALEFCRILTIKRPRWFVWENVPGVFSSFTDDPNSTSYTGYDSGAGPEYDITQTADFATLLAAFSECGYSCAWRVLDSQWFGVPQRRRRVFVVGHIGNDWRPPFAVLFERHSLQGHPSPGEKKEQSLTGTINAGAGRSRGAGIDPACLPAPYRQSQKMTMATQ